MNSAWSLGDMSGWVPTEYKTRNGSSYNAALRRRGSLSIWFDPDMVWVPPPSGKRGRRPSFSNTAIRTCLTLARQGIAKQCPERGWRSCLACRSDRPQALWKACCDVLVWTGQCQISAPFAAVRQH